MGEVLDEDMVFRNLTLAEVKSDLVLVWRTFQVGKSGKTRKSRECHFSLTGRTLSEQIETASSGWKKGWRKEKETNKGHSGDLTLSGVQRHQKIRGFHLQRNPTVHVAKAMLARQWAWASEVRGVRQP